MLTFINICLVSSLVCNSQPLLDYFWDISRDWERLQRTTTLHGRLVYTVYYQDILIMFWSISLKEKTLQPLMYWCSILS